MTDTANDAPHHGSRASLVPVGLVAAVFAATTLVRLGDADIFWHRAAGELVLTQGRIPHHDPFSYASGGVWRYTEALAQVVYALVHRAWGFEGLVVANSLLLFALAGLVARSAEGRPGVRACVVALFGAASYAATAQKPQVFSYLCFALLLLALAPRQDRRIPRLVALPLLFLAWGYLHRAGTLGLAVLGASAVVALARKSTRAEGRQLSLATLGSALALLLNPGGSFYFTSTLDLASRASFRAHLADWQPLDASSLQSHHAMLVPLVVLAVIERIRCRRSPDAELVALALSFAVAVSSARFVPFLAVAAAAPAARALEALVAWFARRAGAAVRRGILELLLASVALSILLGSILPRVPPGFFGVGVEESLVPVHLAEVIRRIPSRGHLYNSFDFGGYFVHALGPERQVLIDGRNDTVYPDAFFDRAIRSQREPTIFDELDRRYAFDVVAMRWVSPGDPTGLFLATDPRFALLAWDDRGAIYVRRDAVDRAFLEREAYRELRVDTAFARAANAPTDPADAQDARFLAEVDRNTRQAPHSARAWFVAALAYRTRGAEDRYREARERLDALVRARDLALPLP